MKIIQVIRDIHPNGGSSGVAYFLREEFDRRGIANDVVKHHGFISTSRYRAIKKAFLFFEVMSFTWAASRTIKRLARDPDCVQIVHNDAIGGDIYVDHGLHKAVVHQRPSMLLRNPIHLFIYLREELRHRLKTYRYIVSLSAYSETLLKQHYDVPPTAVVRIPNGINVERYSAARVPHEGFRLIFVGHEYERKGLRYAIEALKQLPDQVSLTVVGGSNEEMASHKRLAERLGVASRVNFLGRRDDVPQLLASHDLLVLPTRFESWQLVVLEAMAAGVPVLSTPVGCAPEVIVEGGNGYFIGEDSETIAQKVGLAMRDAAGLEAMRDQARETARQYAWRSIADRYVALAERVLDERGQRAA